MSQTNPALPKAPPRRRADRAAETRRKVIDATVRCLYRVGYSAVTFALVAEEAGVSRGIITYHFATKADLMVAVRDAVYLDERAALEAVRRRVGTRTYLAQLAKFTSAGMRREPAIAVNEILLGARADPELIEKLRRTEREIEQRAMAHLLGLYAEVNANPPEDLVTIMRVAVAAFRGLAMAELVQGPEADTDRSVKFLSQVVSPLFPDLSE